MKSRQGLVNSLFLVLFILGKPFKLYSQCKIVLIEKVFLEIYRLLRSCFC
jgi:hypothetical protein